MLNSSGSSRSQGPAGVPAAPAVRDVDQEAAQWWLRRREGLGAGDADLLHRWLDADPAHRAALQAMDDTAQALHGLPPGATASLVAIARASTQPGPTASLPSAKPSKEPADGARRVRWAGNLVEAALAVIVLAIAGTGGWAVVDYLHAQPVFVRHYATPPGQQMTASLPDGSRIELDTATRLDVALYRDRREVRLAGGQAHFSVTADKAKPFHVTAANTLVTVVGTRFAVRHVGSRIQVAVEEGSVRMAQREAGGKTLAAAAGGVLLRAGDVAGADHAGTPLAAGRVGVESVAAWRQGRVVFDNTPLAEAIAEFGRYGQGDVVIRDAHVAAMRITGNFRVTELAGFAAALPHVLPVRLATRDGKTEIMRR